MAEYQLRPTPRNPLLGLLADAAQGADSFARAPFGLDNPPGAIVANLLGLPAVSRTLDRASYGEPLTSGRGQTLRPLNDTTEAAASVVPGAAWLVKLALPAGRAVAREGGQKAAEIAAEQVARSGGLLDAPRVDTIKASSRTGRMRYAPPVQQRPFEADYKAASGEVGEPLRRTIEGAPLTANFVAGRRVVGGNDQALSEAEVEALAGQLVRTIQFGVPRREMPQDAVGAFTTQNGGRIRLSADLAPEQQPLVLGHEVGHAIHDRMPYSQSNDWEPYSAEFRRSFRDTTIPFTSRNIDAKIEPKHLGYKKPDDINNEFWAQAIWSYMTDPNYMKSANPKLAKQIRGLVNENPYLKDFIQFNSAAPAAVGLGLLGPSLVDGAYSEE